MRVHERERERERLQKSFKLNKFHELQEKLTAPPSFSLLSYCKAHLENPLILKLVTISDLIPFHKKKNAKQEERLLDQRSLRERLEKK